MTRCFAIAFVGRSGSSYLEGLLDSHPDAQCLGEILWPGALPPEAGNSVGEKLAATVQKAQTTASGFKLGQLHIFRYPEVLAVLREQNYHIVHLTRRNRVDQYISMRLATENGIWRSDRGAYTQNTFHCDPCHMEVFLDRFEFHDQLITRFMAGIPQLKISYEELVQPEGYAPVLDFLQLNRSKLTSPYTKQHHATQREAIQNYDAMVRHFADTRWASHFVDEYRR